MIYQTNDYLTNILPVLITVLIIFLILISIFAFYKLKNWLITLTLFCLSLIFGFQALGYDLPLNPLLPVIWILINFFLFIEMSFESYKEGYKKKDE
jgi:hypothetical protein